MAAKTKSAPKTIEKDIRRFQTRMQQNTALDADQTKLQIYAELIELVRKELFSRG